MKRKTISVLILTMNRASILDLCLASLSKQISTPDEVVVMSDANNSDNTLEILNKYKKLINLRYFLTDIKGFPKLYNIGISRCKNQIIVLINDDCEVNPDFIRRIKIAHTKNKEAVVQGMTYSLPKKNVYAEIMGDNYKNWVIVNSGPNNSFRTVDNKNVSIPKRVFKKQGYYDERFLLGSEDIEFGKRLFRNNIPIIFDSNIIVHHYERSSLKGFIKQHQRIAKSEMEVDKTLPKNYQIGKYNRRKLLLHFTSALNREIKYLREQRIKDFILLPFLYLSLFIIRSQYYSGIDKKSE